MRRFRFTAVVVAAFTSWPAFGADTDDPLPAAISDPSLATSTYFPPALTTAGVADTGQALSDQALSKIKSRVTNCPLAMPCAATSPALDRALIARPRS